MSREKKDEEGEYYSPFANLEKSVVLQEARWYAFWPRGGPGTRKNGVAASPRAVSTSP